MAALFQPPCIGLFINFESVKGKQTGQIQRRIRVILGLLKRTRSNEQQQLNQKDALFSWWRVAVVTARCTNCTDHFFAAAMSSLKWLKEAKNTSIVVACGQRRRFFQ